MGKQSGIRKPMPDGSGRNAVITRFPLFLPERRTI